MSQEHCFLWSSSSVFEALAIIARGNTCDWLHSQGPSTNPVVKLYIDISQNVNQCSPFWGYHSKLSSYPLWKDICPQWRYKNLKCHSVSRSKTCIILNYIVSNPYSVSNIYDITTCNYYNHARIDGSKQNGIWNSKKKVEESPYLPVM